MSQPSITLQRRKFLVGAGTAAGALVLAACSSGSSPSAASSPSPSASTSGGGGGGGGGKNTGAGKTQQTSTSVTKGSAKSPLPKPTSFNESPLLAAKVKAGKLPKVEKRLPDNPYVIPHSWVTKGNYGGALKMNIQATSGGSSTNIAEMFYAYSPLRFINDGQTVGPGIVDKWKSNAQTSQWEFTLRKGLKWSDGKPVTTKDILFWWQDMANYQPYTPEGVPDDCKSGKGTICKLTAKDDYTWVMKYDAPAPLTADRLATWVNGYEGNGPSWIVPSHYVKQFHPKYAKVPKNWASPGGLWETNASYRQNPKCPTLAGFRLTKFTDGKSLTWERNPYYYVVTKDGDQIPYIDTIVMTQVQNSQVSTLQVQHGEVDFGYGPFIGLTLADVSTLNAAAKTNGFQVLLWDSGSGTASIFFANRDYAEKKYRDLFSEPKFLQALSLGFDRKNARTSIYFDTGDPTTGTMSPKAIEFQVNDTGKKMYTTWRDAYVQHDVAKAKKLLDSLGLKDTNHDGYREFPDGSKLTLRIDRPADATDEYVHHDNLLTNNWKDIGIRGVSHPVPPDSFTDYWANGTYMCHSDWEVGDGPNCLVYAEWLVPMENTRWAPLEGQMYASIGTPAYTSEKNVNPWKRKPPRMMPPKGGPVAKLWKLYNASKVEPDVMKRHQLVWNMMKIHISDGPFFQGTVANYPQPVVIKNGLKNVPTRDQLYLGGFTNPWTVPSPAVYDIETFFWDQPDQHHI